MPGRGVPPPNNKNKSTEGGEEKFEFEECDGSARTALTARRDGHEEAERDGERGACGVSRQDRRSGSATNRNCSQSSRNERASGAPSAASTSGVDEEPEAARRAARVSRDRSSTTEPLIATGDCRVFRGSDEAEREYETEGSASRGESALKFVRCCG